MNTEFVAVKREELEQVHAVLASATTFLSKSSRDKHPKALKALTAALEQPGVEPVAWRLKDEEASEKYGKPIYVYYDAADIRLEHKDAKKLIAMLEPLCTSPQPAQQMQVMKICGHQFQDRNGQWCNFISEQHYADTAADGSWPIREIYAAVTPPKVQPAPRYEPTYNEGSER